MRWALAWIVLAGSAASSGCGLSGVFACASDGQCQSGAVAGTCEANGYCSFPDDECPSGQRFGAAAPDDVANACVDEPEGSSSSTSSQGTGQATTLDPSQGLESTTLEPPESSTTMALDDGTSTGPALTSGPADSGGSTGPSGADCSSLLIDDFDGFMLDPMWNESVDPGGNVSVQGGQLELEVAAGMTEHETLVITELGPMLGGWAWVQITEPGDPSPPPDGGLLLSNGACELAISVTGNAVEASVYGVDEMTGSTVGNEDLGGLPVWLRIQIADNGDVDFHVSHNGTNWNSIADGSFPVCGDVSLPFTASVFAWGQLPRGGLRWYERFEACLP